MQGSSVNSLVIPQSRKSNSLSQWSGSKEGKEVNRGRLGECNGLDLGR